MARRVSRGEWTLMTSDDRTVRLLGTTREAAMRVPWDCVPAATGRGRCTEASGRRAVRRVPAGGSCRLLLVRQLFPAMPRVRR
jgi:hypothetical protein